jgi:hypothetical protein
MTDKPVPDYTGMHLGLFRVRVTEHWVYDVSADSVQEAAEKIRALHTPGKGHEISGVNPLSPVIIVEARDYLPEGPDDSEQSPWTIRLEP